MTSLSIIACCSYPSRFAVAVRRRGSQLQFAVAVRRRGSQLQFAVAVRRRSSRLQFAVAVRGCGSRLQFAVLVHSSVYTAPRKRYNQRQTRFGEEESLLDYL